MQIAAQMPDRTIMKKTFREEGRLLLRNCLRKRIHSHDSAERE